MSHLKHPDKFWGNILFDAGQPHSFGYTRREERRRSRHVYNNFYRSMAHFHGDHEADEEGEIFYAVENFDEPAPPKQEWKEQSDYLSPLKNFLDANVGRPWNEVHSRLSRRTNRNSTCGDHLWQHVRHYIELHHWKIDTDRPIFARPFYVDEEGILRKNGKQPNGSYREDKKDQKKADQLLLKSSHHVHATARVFEDGWNPDPWKYILESPMATRSTLVYSQARILTHVNLCYWGVPIRHNPTTGHWSFRIGPRLSSEDTDAYWSLCESVRAAITYTT